MSTIRQLFFENLAQTSDFPLALEIEKASGHYQYDVDGKKYLDLISGISVSSLGHGHPEIIKAAVAQLEKHMHVMVYGEFIQSVQVEFSSALSIACSGKINSFFFVNSGSEAIEGALKLAKRFTHRPEIISFHKSYHGATHGALSLGGTAAFRNAFTPLLPGMRRFDYNSDDVLEAITDRVACVVIEPLQAEAGCRVADKEFLKKLRHKCNETGTLLVFDEVQTGMGRTGTLFAFQQTETEPDILVLGKALGGGMPLGAFAASAEIMKCLRTEPVLGHITTFGGHPVSCATGKKTLEIIQRDKLYLAVKEKEKLFRSLLQHPVNGKGLLLAVQLDSFEQTQRVIQKCISRGLLTDWFLYNDSALRIAPPLTITEEEITRACQVLNEAVSESART